jgi:hypothetical protein
MLNKGFEGVSGVMADIDEGSDEDESEENSNQKHHYSDDSSKSDSSDDKYVPKTPTKNSEQKQGFEAVSGSGEVPVYTEEVANQDQNAVFKGNYSISIESLNSNHENAAADSNKIWH